MCREDDGRLHLSAEEEMAAEESLSVYCKPVELYNILQRRSMRNPSFLQRCLSYKIQSNNQRRIQVTVSLIGTVSGSRLSQSIFPLYILLARAVPDISEAEYSAVYRFHRACILTNFCGLEGSNQDKANFLLPDINKLTLGAKSGSLAILLVSFAGAQSSTVGVDTTMSHLEDVGGCCLLGVIPVESLYHSWKMSPNLSLGQRVEVTSQVDMKKCFLKLSGSNEDKCLSIRSPYISESVNTSQYIEVNISAEEVGAKEKSAYHSYTCSDISSSSLPHIIRLRAGNVIFNYRYYNNKLQKTEVTEDFSCPFCLAKCASFKGLRHHLPSSHDLFHFEFWVTEEFQAVNITVKTDVWRSEIVADGVDPKRQTFYFRSKKSRHKRWKMSVQNTKNVHPFILETNSNVGASGILGARDLPHASKGAATCAEHVPFFDGVGVSGFGAQTSNDPEFVQSASGTNYAPPAMLQFAKTRKLSIERSDLRNRTLLHKRQFFHSHRAQPMAIEQVLSDRDSEDEVDDDVADFEDRRMLDDFVDVTPDEKQIMHLWNSFVRKQRVLADGHIPWACEGFSRLHGPDLVHKPALLWSWRLFMIKLWNHGLLDARSMNNCNITLEQYQKQDSNPVIIIN